jgi:hypothetical protein
VPGYIEDGCKIIFGAGEHEPPGVQVVPSMVVAAALITFVEAVIVVPSTSGHPAWLLVVLWQPIVPVVVIVPPVIAPLVATLVTVPEPEPQVPVVQVPELETRQLVPEGATPVGTAPLPAEIITSPLVGY